MADAQTFAATGAEMPDGRRLERLRADHAAALLAFELENREYFAASVPDRGDEYFASFDALLAARLAEQATGVCQFHVVVEGDGEIVGRVNLVDLENGWAELGYRIAKKAGGRGLATAAVHEICALAATQYGLTSLRAATTLGNSASQAVLAGTGFVPAGEVMLSGQPGIAYTRHLTA